MCGIFVAISFAGAEDANDKTMYVTLMHAHSCSVYYFIVNYDIHLNVVSKL